MTRIWDEGSATSCGIAIANVSLQLTRERARWQAFRRALRGEDQTAFDQLFVYARTFADAGNMAARACPSEALVLSMLLGLAEEIAALRAQLRRFQSGQTE